MFPEALQHRRYQSPDKRNIKLQRRQRAKIRDGIFSTCQAAKGRVGVARLSITIYYTTVRCIARVHSLALICLHKNSEDYKSTSTRLQPPFTALSLSVNASHRSPRRYSSPRSTRTWPGFLWKVMEEID
ncbi:hypothetical protein PC116_g10951 [Phytophthora cactorum]|nr:hypothetical protein PC116_g10951 [Phytophthora cactorum]